ncbi:MAG: hypothetical protein ACLQU3_12710, partial [Limisphaerales bacterium]
MLQVQTRKPVRTFNRSANIRTDKSTPNLMMTRVRPAVFQPLLSPFLEGARQQTTARLSRASADRARLGTP